MFKVGDRVVCVDNTGNFSGDNFLIMKKVYTVQKSYDSFVVIENAIFGYYNFRFILLTEYRKQKLEKLCLKKEI